MALVIKFLYAAYRCVQDLYLDAPDGNGGKCTVNWKEKKCQTLASGENRIHLDMDDVTPPPPPARAPSLTFNLTSPLLYLLHIFSIQQMFFLSTKELTPEDFRRLVLAPRLSQWRVSFRYVSNYLCF